jgi:LPXTG-site transpeptidase (sortase) family protein
MTDAPRSASERRGPGLWWMLSAVLLVVAVGCVGWGAPQHQHPLAPPVASPATTSTAPVPTSAPVAVVAYSVPISLRVPAIALSVPLSMLGLNPDGSVQVPDNDTEPGWFKLGPSPGEIGSAVILGHVDTYQGPGIFFQLRALQAGDQVQVSLTDGAVATFAVTSVVQYEKAQFPARLVYASQGKSELQLVTCGGAFDSQTGHYLSNVVVYTSFVSATAPTTPTAVPVPSHTPVQI